MHKNTSRPMDRGLSNFILTQRDRRERQRAIVPIQKLHEKQRQNHKAIRTFKRALDEISRSGRATMFAAFRLAGSQHDRAVRLHRHRTITRIAFGRNEVSRPLGDVEERLRRHTQHLHDQRQLITLVLASENGVTCRGKYA